MPEFVQFVASTPVVVPPVGEVVYDKYWVSSMNVDARSPVP